MKTLIVATLLLTGCNDYKCVDGVMYHKVNEDTLVVSGVYYGAKCVNAKETK